MRFNHRRRRRAMVVAPEITLTPLIDTALTLLIIFMVTAPIMHNALKIDLPRGERGDELSTQNDLTVWIDKNGNIFFENNQVEKKECLIELLHNTIKDGVNNVVFVKADEKVSYGDVVQVVDCIKSVGDIAYVALATERK